MQTAAETAAKADAPRWSRILTRFHKADTARGVFEIVTTVTPFFAAWGLAYAAYAMGSPWLYGLAAVLAAGLLVRLFMIQHDCGHGSFFSSQTANDWVGRVASVLTLTPYDHWRRSHAIHHASSGNLDRRGMGDIDTLTVAEYAARSRWGRLRYRLYRHPAIMFGVGPAYLFLLESRLPVGFMRKGWRPWFSTMATNAAIAAVAAAVISAVGVQAFLTVHLPIVALGASAGVWLFFVQHQFEGVEWDGEEKWSMQHAALHGSSHYDLPAVLRWFTANIGVHHVHHLSSRIPFYRLPQVLKDHPELRDVGRLTLLQSFKCVPLALWDEPRRKLISFRDYARIERASRLAAAG